MSKLKLKFEVVVEVNDASFSSDALKAILAEKGLDAHVEKNDWTEVGYQEYLNAAWKHLNEPIPDLVQGSEKIWGCFAFLVATFYAQMKLDVKSHRATVALAKYAIQFSSGPMMNGIRLNDSIRDAEATHHNFYEGRMSKEELLECCNSIEFFSEVFPKIRIETVRKDLSEFIDGKKKTDDDYCLKQIRFSKFKETSGKIVGVGYRFNCNAW